MGIRTERRKMHDRKDGEALVLQRDTREREREREREIIKLILVPFGKPYLSHDTRFKV